MCGKGTNTTTNQTSSSADPQAAQSYRDLLQRAQGVASTPYQAYTGELTAPVNAQQQLGVGNINSNASFAQPYVQQAAGIAGAAANPLTQQQIQQYQNPYTQSVVDATQAQFNRNNAQQQTALKGNTIASGALGGNREGIAQANLSSQQATQQNPIIAGLYANSYNQGVQTAGQQFQQNPLAAAGSLANFGISGQGAALSGAGAQLGAGTLQQQTQQQADTANYGQYQQAQAYPYQQTQWLAGLDTGVGSQLGGTSSGSTTGPAPNPLSQILGLGLAGAGAAGGLGWKPFAASGGAIRAYAGGGVVPRMADGGVPVVPWSGGVGWIPQMNIHGGSGAPHAGTPSAPQQTAFDPTKFAQGIAGLGKGVSGGANPLAYGSAVPGAEGVTSVGGAPLVPNGYNFTGLGVYASGGGVVRGYANGGAPPIDFTDPSWENPDVGSGIDPAVLREAQSPVINPNEPVRMPDQAAVDAWRAGTPAAPSAGSPAQAKDDDDAELPAKATPTQGGPQGRGVASAGFTPPYPITATAPSSPPLDDAFGIKGLSHNVSTGLLSAGLGMLASRSPFLGNAVGEGGLAGLSAYGSAEEHDRKVASEAQKLSTEAKKAANDLARQTFTTNEAARHSQVTEARSADAANETSRHNKATEANAADKAPIGYQKAADGTLAYIKGGPHDPDQISAETSARIKKGTELDDDTVDAVAHRVAQGDTRAVIGLGRNPAGIAQIQKRVAQIFKEQGLDHEEGAKAILANVADQAGRMTAERTQAGIAAKLAVYGRNVDNAIGVATKASSEANRTQFTPVNVALNAFKAKTGDPKIVALGQSLNTLTNEYARAIGSGHGTVHDKEQAETQLNQARSHEQLVAIMNIMRQEIQMTKKSMPEAREEMRELYSRPSSDRMRPAAGTTAAPAAGGFTPPPGAIPQTHGGRTYYYDPATKQPYPGQ